ncbi:hypothetical protein [Peptoniphilus catoniae]|uniref:hypothetical protein n=1 Tax=Peptoniphilus catoniae TaxID=1660341 RepID=UPI0010FDC87E|nr:hypothetical protein [Peptoniphilus catoniae]
MILLEDKLAIFNKMVYQKKKQECDERLERAKEKYSQDIEKKKIELEEMERDLVERRIALAKKKSFEMEASINENRRVLGLKKDREFLQKLIEDLYKRAKDFTDTDEYKDFMIKNFKEVIEELEGDYYLALTEKDRHFKDDFLKIAKDKKINLDFIELDKEFIGGFNIYDKDKTYRINSSLKAKIDNAEYEIGKLLHFTLRKEEYKIEQGEN